MAWVRIAVDCDGLGAPDSAGPKLYDFCRGSELPLLRDDDRDFFKVAYEGRPVFVAKSCCVGIERIEEAARDTPLLPHTFAELRNWVRSSRPPAILAAVAAVLAIVAWVGDANVVWGDFSTDNSLAQAIVYAVFIGYPLACVAVACAAVVMGRRPRLAAALLFPAAGVLILPILAPGLVAATAAVLALTPTPPGGSETPSERWQRRDVVRALLIGIGGLAALICLMLLLYVLLLLNEGNGGD